LVVAEAFVEKPLDGVPAFALADPNYAGTINVIDDGGILMAFAVGDLIDSHGLKAPDPMSVTQTDNAAVKQVGEGRCVNVKYPGCGLLGHYLAINEHHELKAIRDVGIASSPGDVFLCPAMGATVNLSWAVAEPNAPPAYRDVSPSTLLFPHDDATSTATHRTPTTVFVRLHPQMKAPLSDLELEIAYAQTFQVEEFYDKLFPSHRFLPSYGFWETQK
jgi:hypothetical protein